MSALKLEKDFFSRSAFSTAFFRGSGKILLRKKLQNRLTDNIESKQAFSAAKKHLKQHLLQQFIFFQSNEAFATSEVTFILNQYVAINFIFK